MNKIIFLDCLDDFLLEKEEKKIIKKIKLDDIDIISYDCKNTTLSEIVDDANTIPFISSVKVITLSNPYFLSTEKSNIQSENDILNFTKYISNPNPTTFLIIKSKYEKIDNRKKIVKHLKENSEYIKVKDLDVNQIKKMVNDEIDKINFDITPEALEKLIFRSDLDLQTIFNEINKLENYCYDKKSISVMDIEELVVNSVEENVFELVKSIFENDKKKVINIYNELITNKHEPIMILGLLSSRYRELLNVKLLLKKQMSNTEISKITHLSPGRIYYLIKSVKNLNENYLKNNIIKLSELDFQVKSGIMDRFLALEMFLLI